MFDQSDGYDERLLKVMLAEFVRRNFTKQARQEMPDVRVQIAERFDGSECYNNQSIIVISGAPLPRPLGPSEPSD